MQRVVRPTRRRSQRAIGAAGPILRVLAAGVLGLFCALPLAHAQSAAEARPPEGETADVKARARDHFQRGLEHFSRSEWAPALAEFLRSRELYPMRSNTQNAAVSLSRLGRYDEALDMFEALLREFQNISEKDLADVEIELKKLQGLVGTIEVRATDRGAAVMIDGRLRGTTPLGGRIRVTAGSHAVRIYKEGALPFEIRVDVAGGQNRAVTPTLTVLQRSGRLKVSERSGVGAQVLVDGIVVGKAPWEGSVAPGNHAVVLRGSGNLGTAPVPTRVRADDVTVLTLALEQLDCALTVNPTPVGATVAIDRVEVGHGTWEGRLRCGEHRVEGAAEGFLPTSRRIVLSANRSAVVTIDLERDPESALWKAANPPRVFVEAELAAVAGASLGGDVASSCTGECRSTPPLGLFAGARAGYQWSSGIGLGLTGGYLVVQARLENRPVTVFDVPTPVERAGIAEDRLVLRGAMLGADAHLQRGESWPWMVRLGAGVLLGSVADQRSATIDRLGTTGNYPRQTEVVSARFAYIAPEVRLARRFGAFELSGGLRSILLIALTQPELSSEPFLTDQGSAMGQLDFADETLTGRTVLLLAAGLGARYSFM